MPFDHQSILLCSSSAAPLHVPTPHFACVVFEILKCVVYPTAVESVYDRQICTCLGSKVPKRFFIVPFQVEVVTCCDRCATVQFTGLPIQILSSKWFFFFFEIGVSTRPRYFTALQYHTLDSVLLTDCVGVLDFGHQCQSECLQTSSSERSTGD